MRNRAIGLNFIDTYYRSGLYPAPGLPSGLGSEGAGEVEAVGSEVTRFKVGDRVAYATGPLGAYSELHVLAEEKLVHLPDGIDFEQAAAVMLKGSPPNTCCARPTNCGAAKPFSSMPPRAAWACSPANGPRPLECS